MQPLVSASHFEALAEGYDSDLEHWVLDAIGGCELSLPDEAQRVIYDGEVPLANVTSSTSQGSSPSSTACRTTGTMCRRPTAASRCDSRDWGTGRWS